MCGGVKANVEREITQGRRRGGEIKKENLLEVGCRRRYRRRRDRVRGGCEGGRRKKKSWSEADWKYSESGENYRTLQKKN